MSRELISEDALKAYIETELHKHRECNSHRVKGIARLQAPDAEGCNWSPTLDIGPRGGKAQDPCAGIAERIVGEARKKFNLA